MTNEEHVEINELIIVGQTEFVAIMLTKELAIRMNDVTYV